MVASSVSCTHLSWVTKWDFKDRIELPELVTRITRGDRAHQPLERGVQSDKRSANIGTAIGTWMQRRFSLMRSTSTTKAAFIW